MQDIFRLMYNTGPVARVVLIVLFSLSGISWGIIFWKAVIFSKASFNAKPFMRAFKIRAEWNALYKISRVSPNAPQSLLFVRGLQEVMHQKKKGVAHLNDMRSVVTDAMELAMGDVLSGMERALVILSTIVGISPFLGLFGTVWGVMEAFISIGRQGSADISTVGPGIAEALITTVVGLFTAIPALAAYNLCVAGIRKWEERLNRFVNEFLYQMDREPHS